MNRVLLCLLALAAISCRGAARPDTPAPAAAAPGHAGGAERGEAEVTPAAVVPRRIVVLGDSLTAGLGLQQEEAYPALMQRKVKEKGYEFEVVNAGVSGDTSADGLRRTNWALDGDVRLLILALGANDGLRGLPPAQMKHNLQEIITRARQRGIPVLLVGMEAPPNYGEQYGSAFRQVFRDLARENRLTLVPFLLQDVAGVADLNQADGIHPTSAGAARIAEHLWPAIEEMIGTDRPR